MSRKILLVLWKGVGIMLSIFKKKATNWEVRKSESFTWWEFVCFAIDISKRELNFTEMFKIADSCNVRVNDIRLTRLDVGNVHERNVTFFVEGTMESLKKFKNEVREADFKLHGYWYDKDRNRN